MSEEISEIYEDRVGDQVEDEIPSDNEDKSVKSVKSINKRLGCCEVCQVEEAKYTCPKCEVKTCSLSCLQIHKKELECDGVRDKTRYIPIKKMTTMDYMSDYNFLEDCTRFVHSKRPKLHADLPQFLHRLRDIARQRNTHVQFLGKDFTRRKLNATFYDGKIRKIFWTVQWVFVNAENTEFLEKKCCETDNVGKLLAPYIDPLHADASAPAKNMLEHYRSRGFGGIKILLKAERIKNCGKRFYDMDLTKSLKENLSGKGIVEFPIFLVIFREIKSEFDIIESDDEELMQKKSQREDQGQCKKEDHAERTNFLFTDESLWDHLSDDEETVAQK
ncbi:box C/D snoRNA protein 1 [Sergentomyia squamirostris]